MAKRKKYKAEEAPPMRPDPRNPKVVVISSISGGKDSTAMSLWLTEQGIEHVRVFADTGWECGDTYKYLRETLPPHVGEIIEVKGPRGFADMVRKKGMFPSKRRRFCTSELKVKPILFFIEEMMDKGYEVINCVGIRALESRQRSKMEEWEFNRSMGVWVWRPLITWTVEQVLEIHNLHNVPVNPLYHEGFSRVGCWPCVFANKKNIARIADREPELIDFIRGLELEVQATAEARYEARGETFESLGYMRPSFFILRRQGKSSMATIDDIVDWSRTSYGGKQFELWNDDFEGCARWGLCDLGDGVVDLEKAPAAILEEDDDERCDY